MSLVTTQYLCFSGIEPLSLEEVAVPPVNVKNPRKYHFSLQIITFSFVYFS